MAHILGGEVGAGASGRLVLVGGVNAGSFENWVDDDSGGSVVVSTLGTP